LQAALFILRGGIDQPVRGCPCSFKKNDEDLESICCKQIRVDLLALLILTCKYELRSLIYQGSNPNGSFGASFCHEEVHYLLAACYFHLACAKCASAL
jgi:hypothetical protein